MIYYLWISDTVVTTLLLYSSAHLRQLFCHNGSRFSVLGLVLGIRSQNVLGFRFGFSVLSLVLGNVLRMFSIQSSSVIYRNYRRNHGNSGSKEN